VSRVKSPSARSGFYIGFFASGVGRGGANLALFIVAAETNGSLGYIERVTSKGMTNLVTCCKLTALYNTKIYNGFQSF